MNPQNDYDDNTEKQWKNATFWSCREEIEIGFFAYIILRKSM